MKRKAVIAFALIAAGLGYGLGSWWTSGRNAALANASGSDIEWLRTEFGLNDEQFAAIRALHEAYTPVCTIHCADIISSRSWLEALRQQGAPASEIKSAEEQLAELEAKCNKATWEHMQKVASVMDPEQGRRFLAMMEPRMSRLPHDGYRGLSR